jgi:hypothetical protein
VIPCLTLPPITHTSKLQTNKKKKKKRKGGEYLEGEQIFSATGAEHILLDKK